MALAIMIDPRDKRARNGVNVASFPDRDGIQSRRKRVDTDAWYVGDDTSFQIGPLRRTRRWFEEPHRIAILVFPFARQPPKQTPCHEGFRFVAGHS
jgi:hypothetical protein